MTAEPQIAIAEQSLAGTFLEPEAQARADCYALVAALLRRVPGEALVAHLAGIDVADAGDEFSRALMALRLAAREVSQTEIDDEYHYLFVGLGRGELVPYASWYLTGFLMEKPLGELRHDLRLLGFDRQAGVNEPEDHIAALCEVMSMLITDGEADLTQQRSFFDKHVGCWADRFFADLEHTDAAVFFRAVARLGTAFMALEQRYLTQET